MKNKKLIYGIAIFVIVITLTFIGYLKYMSKTACSKDAKPCLDGSVVGRVPPNCDFAPCPKEVSNFEECMQVGYPVMESYPRQCKTRDGKTFVEVISSAEGE